MKNQIAKITLFGLVAAALAFTPSFGFAQDATTNAPAQSVAPKKHKYAPFHGKVSAVDSAAQTLTVGTLTITVTSTTKISKAATGEAATFEDITVGEFVSGAYKKTADGTLKASTIHIGRKARPTPPPSVQGGATNSVAN
jgi:hypothetical protein